LPLALYGRGAIHPDHPLANAMALLGKNGVRIATAAEYSKCSHKVDQISGRLRAEFNPLAQAASSTGRHAGRELWQTLALREWHGRDPKPPLDRSPKHNSRDATRVSM